MNPTVDFVYLVIARFNGRLEIWRKSMFDSRAEAMDEWARHVEAVGHEMLLEFVRVIRVNLDLSDGVSLDYVYPEGEGDK